ncbi:uncharacterized protein LOC144355937, partial [Saccoglossus kowalevskii]
SSHSYLDWPRIHFAGSFRADSPTGNNKCENYDITSFDQDIRKNPKIRSWNSNGSGRFMLEGCEITSVCYDNGECVTTPHHELIGQPVISNYNRPHAKMADLDTAHMITSIFGMYIKIPHMFEARYVDAQYRDRFKKATDQNADGAVGAVFQSLLVDLQWDQDMDKYRILREMQDIASQYPQPNALSISMIVDYFEMSESFGNFSQGRVVGTIGIAGAAEPFHTLRHRELHPFGTKMGKSLFRAFPQRGKILLDIGNGLIHSSGAPNPELNKRLQVVYPVSVDAASFSCMTPVIVLGDIPYTSNDWYECSAGIVQIPTHGNLSMQQIQQ